MGLLGRQYGLTCDEAGHWFVNTNSQHLRQIVLPDEYLRRNPYLAVSATTVDIPEHGAACQVFRISPFEAWRVERTGRRASAPDSARYPKTELVPGGYITSACSPCVYEADRFPKEYRGAIGDAYRVDARFVIWEGKDVVKVPAGALFRKGGDKQAVFVQEEGRAVVRPVKIGHNNGLEAEVLSGLSEGDQVILHPSDKIKDGVPIAARDNP